MQAHPTVSNAALRNRRAGLDAVVVLTNRLHPIVETTPRLSRLGTRRDPRSDGRGTEHCHQRIVGGEWIFVRLDSAPLELPQDVRGRLSAN